VSTTGLDMYLGAERRLAEGDAGFSEVQNLLVGVDTYADEEKGWNWRSAHISGYDFYPDKTKEKFRELVSVFDVGAYIDPQSPSATVAFTDSAIEVHFTAAYWRKANQIHHWFVENVQGGEDECNPFPTSRGKLQELAKACGFVLGRSELEDGQVHIGTRWTAAGVEEMYEDGKVVVEPAVAQEILPTASGFFFGGTEYDEWYVRDLEDTVLQIERALKMPDIWTFVYQSSW